MEVLWVYFHYLNILSLFLQKFYHCYFLFFGHCCFSPSIHKKLSLFPKVKIYMSHLRSCYAYHHFDFDWLLYFIFLLIASILTNHYIINELPFIISYHIIYCCYLIQHWHSVNRQWLDCYSNKTTKSNVSFFPQKGIK